MSLAAGQIALDSDFDAIERASSQKPVGRMVQAVVQSGIANNTMTAMTFTTEVLDSHGFHDVAVNNSRVTPNVAGWYRFHGAISWNGQADYTSLEVVFRQNGGSASAPATRYVGAATSTAVYPATALIYCNGTTDYVELVGRHTRTGAAATTTAISVQFATVMEWQYEAA